MFIVGAKITGRGDELFDIVVEDGIISQIVKHGEKIKGMAFGEAIYSGGLMCCPGFVDLHVHFRDPGLTQKEDLKTGSLAAAKGGFTTVCMMPNTKPAIDNVDTLLDIDARGREIGRVNLLATSAMSEGQMGEKLVDFASMASAETICKHKTGHGVCGITEDGKSLLNDTLMNEVAIAAKNLGIPVMDHTENMDYLMPGACMNEGEVSASLGLVGIPNITESSIVERDVEIARKTGAHFHIQHISTKESVDIIRKAKEDGVNITCETAPHFFTLTDETVREKGTLAKMNPPLRTEVDRKSIIDGLVDGTIDAIATDHAPHEAETKELPMPDASFGIIGLETSFALSYTELVDKGYISLEKLIELMSVNPAEIIGLNDKTRSGVTAQNSSDNFLKVGDPADIVLIETSSEYKIDASKFSSKSSNSPFDGMTVKGRVIMTICGGNITHGGF